MRWKLRLWNQQERRQFEDTMLQCWLKLQDYFQGSYLTEEYFPGSPRVLSINDQEAQLIRYMGVDWRDCFDGITPKGDKIRQLKELLESVSPADRVRLEKEYYEKQDQKSQKTI